MKRRTGWAFLVTLAFLAMASSYSMAADLDENLQLLQPLMGKDWVGGYVGPDAPDIEILLNFEQILGGKAVKYTRKAEAANFEAVTHFYWIQEKGEVHFINLNNRGIVEEGVAKVVEGTLVLYGKSYWTDRTMEFKTTWSIDSEGTLTDTYTRMENGEWVPGHVQEFEEK